MSAHLCLVVSAVGFHCCRQIQAGQREVRSSDARGPEVSRRSWPGFFGGFDEAIRPVYVERGGRSIEHPSARTPSDSLDDDSGRFSGVGSDFGLWGIRRARGSPMSVCLLSTIRCAGYRLRQSILIRQVGLSLEQWPSHILYQIFIWGGKDSSQGSREREGR